jgi:annexin A7/11
MSIEEKQLSDIVQLLRQQITGSCNNSTLVTIFGSRTFAQIDQIRAAYDTTFSAALRTDINNKTSGDFKNALLALLREPELNDAETLMGAFRGMGTDETRASEVLCLKDQKEMKVISDRYRQQFNEELIKRAASEQGGNLGKLWALLQGERKNEPGHVENHADVLYRAGEGKLGTDEKKFVAIIGGHTREHVAAVAQAYEQKRGKTLVAAIKSEFSGDLEYALLACVQEKKEYYGERLMGAMYRLRGVDEDIVSRIIIGQRESNLRDINQYLRNTGKRKPLMEHIVSKISDGAYRQLLVAMVSTFIEATN